MAINLLSSTSRVSTPFIKVTIGDYTFGVYDKVQFKGYDSQLKEAFRIQKIKYPNYVQELSIQKINGQVNKYTLRMSYPITENDDPNFFEKVFSSVSLTRRITFSYGDLSAPNFMYRNESAIITNVRQNFAPASSVITYTVSATSTGDLASAGTYSFGGRSYAKPSDVIKELLYNKSYGLQEIFPGMRNRTKVEQFNWIPSNDKPVRLEAKMNTSILDYISYLVNCMSPIDTNNSLIKNGVYVMIVVDDAENSDGDYVVSHGASKMVVDGSGTYFKIIYVDNQITESGAYSIDIGYPSANVVTDFQIENDETYSIYYDFQQKLNDASYVQRIDDTGNVVDVFAPTIAKGTSQFRATEAEKAWWTKVTSYPIKASVTLKGLLRSAILMTHVRLNVLFYGKKHDSSGLYIITKQTDTVSGSGFKTVLNMVRIDKDVDVLDKGA